MKKEVIHNLVIIAVLMVAVGFIFMNSNSNFTGLAILEGYNETSCAGAGYTWENITNQSCINITICTNETIEQCECSGYEYINDTQGDCINWSSCINEACNDEQNCTEIIIGGQCVGDICDSSHLNLCLSEGDCTGAGGYWYDGVCNANAQCNPNCADSDCGDDGCGGSCGTCNSDETCKSGSCEKKEDKKVTASGNDNTKSIITGASTKKTCVPEWNCSDWTECVEGVQDRVCKDNNNCNIEDGQPKVSQSCQMPETCFDNIMNQNEKDIDCGGICEKKCSIFTIIGSVVNGPIESSKEFFLENKIMSLIILGAFVFLIGGVFVLKIFLIKSKKKIGKQDKNNCKMNDEEIAKRIGDVTNI
jgi:hypothetical protein